MSRRRRALNLESSSMPSSMRCCDLAPKPFMGAIWLLRAASLRLATESTPSSSAMSLIRFGPNPGMPSISMRPGGVLV